MPNELRVTVDPRMLSWAVTSASVLALEFDKEIQRRRREHDLEWGVPVRLTVGPDRVLVEVEAGEDLALSRGKRIPGATNPQALSLRYSVPARVSGYVEGQPAPSWVVPADSLRESLHTASRKRADELGYFWREVASRDMNLEFTSVDALREQFIQEQTAADPNFIFDEDSWRESIGLTIPKGPVLLTGTKGRKDYFCPVFAAQARTLRPADYQVQSVVGDGVEFDLKRMLAAGFAAQAGSEGVIVDPTRGRIVLDTEDGVYAFGTSTTRQGERATAAPASDTQIATALGLSAEEARREMLTLGQEKLGPAVISLDRSGNDIHDAILDGLDDESRALVVEALRNWALREDVVTEEQLETLPSQLVDDQQGLLSAIMQIIAHMSIHAGKADKLAQDNAAIVGRAHLQSRLRREGRIALPVRSLMESGRGAVLSPRMMFATAFSAIQAENLYGEAAKEEVLRRARVIQMSAAAAAADLDDRFREELTREVGTQIIGKAKASGRTSEKIAEQILAAFGADVIAPRQLREAVSRWASDQGDIGPDRLAARTDELTMLLRGDRVKASVAAAFDLAGEAGKTNDLVDALAGVVGRAVTEADVRSRLSTSGDETPGETVINGYQFADAHLRRAERRSVFEADVRRTLDAFGSVYEVPTDAATRIRRAMAANNEDELRANAPWASWASSFLHNLQQGDVSGENVAVIESIRTAWATDLAEMVRRPGGDAIAEAAGVPAKFDPKNAHQVDALGVALAASVMPSAETLDFRHAKDLMLGGRLSATGNVSIPLARIRDVTAGRIGVDDQHRAHFSVVSPDGRWGVSVVDRAREPRPEILLDRIGLAPENGVDQVEDMLDGRGNLAEFRIPSDDVVRLANAIADATDTSRRGAVTTLVARWKGAEAQAETPEGVRQIDLTRSLEGYALPRASAAQPETVGGTFEMHVLGEYGHEVISVPVTSATAIGGSADAIRKAVLTSLVDATWIHDILGFAAESASSVPVAIAKDGSLVFRGDTNRIAVRVPPAARSLIPARDRALISVIRDGSLTEWSGAEEQTVDGIKEELEPFADLFAQPEQDFDETVLEDAAIDVEPVDSVVEPTATPVADVGEEEIEFEPVDEDLFRADELDDNAADVERVVSSPARAAEHNIEAMRSGLFGQVSEETMQKKAKRYQRMLEGKLTPKSRLGEDDQEIVAGQGSLFDLDTPPAKVSTGRKQGR